MTDFSRYVKSIKINGDVLKELWLRDGSDRLGSLAKIELQNMPNMPYCIKQVSTMLEHIYNLLGYDNVNVTPLDSCTENADCWTNYRQRGKDQHFIEVNHKYWSYKTVKLFMALIEAVCMRFGIPHQVYGDDSREATS